MPAYPAIPTQRPIRMAACIPAPCRFCTDPTFLAGNLGPAHRCCLAWAAVIAVTGQCPACAAAKHVLAAQRAHKSPKALPALPMTLPDGSACVPAILTEPIAADAAPIELESAA